MVTRYLRWALQEGLVYLQTFREQSFAWLEQARQAAGPPGGSQPALAWAAS